jgi:hypothetical protein
LFTSDVGSNRDQAINSLKAFCKHSNYNSYVKVKAEFQNRDQAKEILDKIEKNLESKRKKEYQKFKSKKILLK